jgi:epoxyqueuosine reductase
MAIGNSRDPALAVHAEHLLADPSAVIRGAAVWALGRLVPKQRLAALAAERGSVETDPSVRDEWASEGVCA